jgi:transcriptional regulator with XRE-family HTH domain
MGIRREEYTNVEKCCKIFHMPEKVMTAWVTFGRELRRRRDARGMTLDRAARETGYGASTISKYENAYRAPKKDFVQEVEALYRTNGDLLRRWEEAQRASNDPDWHRKVVTAEEQASGIKFWNPGLVPGMLQTPDYARQIFLDGRPLDTAEEIERLVELRVSRLNALRQMNNPRMLAILSEAVIRARVGTPAVMKGQLEHLLELSDTGVVRILILPTEAPYYGGASGPFRLLEFRDRPTLVEAEHASGGELLGGDPVTRLAAVYGELQTWALPPVASRQRIVEAIGGSE